MPNPKPKTIHLTMFSFETFHKDEEHLRSYFKSVLDATPKNKYTHRRKRNEIIDYVKGLRDVTDKYDAFIFVILTELVKKRGEGNLFKAFDENFTLEEIFEELSKIPKLVAKPKFFIIQATDVTYTSVVKGDEGGKPVKIPKDANRLVIYSTLPRQNNPRNTSISYLVEAFIKAMKEHAPGKDALTLTTYINREFARLLGSPVPQRMTSPLPLTSSTLTDLLYLFK